MTTILVTGVGGPAGRSLVTQLASHPELRIVGADMRAVVVPELDRVEILPPAASPDLLTALVALVRRHRVDIVLPTVSEELPAMSLLASMLARGAWAARARDVSIVIGSLGAVGVAADKLHTAVLLEGAGVAVPAFSSASAFVDAEDARSALGGDVVVKPRVSRGGRGVAVLDGTRPSPSWALLSPGMIVQRYMPGTEYAVQVHRSRRSRDAIAVVLEKTALAAGDVGNATQVRRCDPGEASDVARAALAAATTLDLVGPLDVDVRRDELDVPRVLEINARFGAWSAAAPELLERVLLDARARLGVAA